MKTSFCTGQPKQRLGFLTGKIQISEDFDRMGQDDLEGSKNRWLMCLGSDFRFLAI